MSIWEQFTKYLPGYEAERERFQRRVREGGPNRQDFGELLLTLPNAIGAGPKPGAFGRAAVLEAVPQRDPAVTGGGSRFDPSVAPNSSTELGTRAGVESPKEIRARYNEPPRREGRAAANDDVSGPMAVQTKGGDAPNPSAVTPERALSLLQSLGARVTQVKNVRGTTYIKFEDPANPSLSFQAQPTIRIPADAHAGRPMTPGEAGVLFDTASQPGRAPLDPRTTQNAEGQPFADFRVLEDALRRRFSPPREATAAPSRPEGADFSPDQPRLLSASVPIWAGVLAGLNAEPNTERDENAGRFAEPRIASPEGDLTEDTRALRRRVGTAADELEGMTRKHQDRVPSVWDQFERTG